MSGLPTGLIIAYDNLVELSTTVVTATSQAAKFPAINVKSGFRQVRWRSTGLSNQYIMFDFGEEKDFGAVILTNHNLTSSAIVNLRGSTDGFVSSDDLLTPVQVTGDPIVMYSGNNYYRYAALEITDTDNTNSYVSIGKIFLGTYITSRKNYDYGWSTKKIDLSQEIMSLNGVTHTNVKPKFTTIPLPFTYVDDEQKREIEVLESVVGTSYPFFITLDPDLEPSGSTYYVKFAELPQYVNEKPFLWNYSLAFKENL
jgi:hypothetical protein